jgi:hypothetical protein
MTAPNPVLGPSFEKALTAEVGGGGLDSSLHHWFVSALLASILALVCAMIAAARSEGAPFLMLDTGGHQANIWSMAYTPDGI